MKLKKQIVTILLSLLITAPIFSQGSNKYRQIVQTEFGIDSNKNYSGEDLIEILSICLEEKDRAIEDAYCEGYKTGVLEYSPQVEFYKKQCSLLEKNNENLKISLSQKEKDDIIKQFSFLGIGLVCGTVSGSLITLKLVP